MVTDKDSGAPGPTLTGLRAIMLLLGVTLTAFSFLAGSSQYLTAHPADLSAAQNVLASVGASFLFALILDVFSQWRQALTNRRFRRFFGNGIERGDICLVYPDFVLNKAILRPQPDIQGMSFLNKRTPHFDKEPFLIFPHVLVEVDVQAAVFVAGMLGEYVEKTPALIPDSVAVPSIRTSFISFGLNSNDMTWLYLSTDPAPMFELEEGMDGKRHFVLSENGQRVTYGWSEQADHAIIVKFRPLPVDEPDRMWIICAGLGASGTTAAAWRFVKSWKDYHRRFESNDFVIILKVSNNLAAYESATEVASRVRRKPAWYSR